MRHTAPNIACMLVASFLCLFHFAAHSQSYPSKPVRFIVPFGPGGGNDVMARIIAKPLSSNLKQQVIVDNRAGAGGAIGSVMAANAAPDGYTILMGHIGTLSLNPSLYAKLPYSPEKDFTPIVLVATAQNILVVHPSLPVKSVRDLIGLARSRPGQLNYVSGGVGGAGHLAGELLKSLANVNMVHVAYKGAGAALTDLVAGHVHLMITNMPAAMPHVKSGRLRALAVTGGTRSRVLSDLPTIAEQGVPGYELINWFGVVAPAGTPINIVQRLNKEIVKSLETREMRDQLAGVGAEPAGGTPAQFGAHISSEIKKWAQVIRDANIGVN